MAKESGGAYVDLPRAARDGGVAEVLREELVASCGLRGHDCEISCLTIDCSRTYAASGQVGAEPLVLVWAVSSQQEVARLRHGRVTSHCYSGTIFWKFDQTAA